MGAENSDELRAGVRLLFDAIGGGVGLVRDMCRAASPCPAARSVADVAFGGIRLGAALGSAVVDGALAISGLGERHQPLQDTEGGRRVRAVLNGAIGDRLASRYPALATPLSLRVDGVDVAVDRESLACQYPSAAGHIVVLVHGLVHDDESWRRQDSTGAALPDFGRRLADDLGATVLYVRYNTGRRICDNGRDLAELLGSVVNAWPVPVLRISLVGHSMGGLVARSAVHQAVGDGREWSRRLAAVVCLGSPHQGSYLEHGADLAVRVLRRFPVASPLGNLVAARSSGIKDLRYGYLDAADWEQPSRPAYAVAPEGRQYFLAATIARNPAGVPGRVLGDLLVTPASATDPTQPAAREALGGLHHLDLLRHPRVYAQVRRWLVSRNDRQPV